jgi:AcrR family transcriptional regulator
LPDPDREGAPAPSHVPRQARSRETLTRLLDAAEAVLAGSGLDAATVPAIAQRAGLSVGAVYRRFPDKDALLREVYFRMFARMRALNEEKMDPEQFRDVPLDRVLGGIVRGMVRHYRENRTLMQAMLRYADTHSDAEFRLRAAELNGTALAHLVSIAASKRDEMRHPDPEGAARFALLTVGLVLRGIVLTDQPPPGFLLGEDFSVEEELTRMVLGYLGVDGGSGSAS